VLFLFVVFFFFFLVGVGLKDWVFFLLGFLVVLWI